VTTPLPSQDANTPAAPKAAHILAVVLNYNGPADTIRCVDWLSRLAPAPPVILVVDNASHEGSVTEIRAAHPGLEILELPSNLGFSGGNNRGIKHAVAKSEKMGRPYDFIWLINNDTYGEDDALAALVGQANADEKIGVVGSVLISPAPERRVQSRGTHVSPAFALTWTNHDRGASVNSLCGASMLIRTAALEEVGLLDETFFFCWEDADLCQRLLAAGWKLAVAEGSVVTHKEGASAAGSSPFRMFHHVRGIVLFARRHSPVPWFAATFAMLLCAANCLLLRRRPTLLAAVWSGFIDGWKTPAVPIPAFSAKSTRRPIDTPPIIVPSETPDP
jgi:GT2 family glycosyltransferase